MNGIAAQVSLYLLHQERLAPAIDEAFRIFRAHGLDVEPGPMSTVITGEDEAIFSALQEAFRRAAEQGHAVMTVTFSNACPAPCRSKKAITYKPIGCVENIFNEPGAPDTMRAAESRIILEPALTEGLAGLAPGQQLMVIFDFHRAQGYNLRQHPQGDV